ncbi:MAG: deaminase, partial [Dehalococcoidales bacterium]|nr:deaminase [Dehalococcoidales bacterium]
KFGMPIVEELTVPNPESIYVLPEAIRRIMRSFRTAENKRYFVIDAFRNPFEIEYFRSRYSQFYLLAVDRNEPDRNLSLYKSMSEEQGSIIKKRERGELIQEKTKENISEWVTSQDINECLLKADYFINNTNGSSKEPINLAYHLLRVLCLASHPGCVPPTKKERSMHLAMTAGQNSGCLSRHVGAIVTDHSGYVLGVGWNDPPTGQTPCSLRTSEQLLNSPDPKIFSEYERSERFTNHIRSRCLGNNPFCFKDELKKITNKSQNEYTRAVHAEENALLQATRHGLPEKDSILYTTLSPCTLCAKKSYQLGVSKIIFLEEYTGIPIQQTLNTGQHAIQIEKFVGATGWGFLRLFGTLLSEKDLINLYL